MSPTLSSESGFRTDLLSSENNKIEGIEQKPTRPLRKGADFNVDCTSYKKIIANKETEEANSSSAYDSAQHSGLNPTGDLTDRRELSKEATVILSALPLLDYMRSPYLMFPVEAAATGSKVD